LFLCCYENFQFGREKITFQPDQEEPSSDSDSDGERNSPNFDSVTQNGDEVKLIHRQAKVHTKKIPNVRSLATLQHEFQLKDAMYFCRSGIEVSSIL